MELDRRVVLRSSVVVLPGIGGCLSKVPGRQSGKPATGDPDEQYAFAVFDWTEQQHTFTFNLRWQSGGSVFRKEATIDPDGLRRFRSAIPVYDDVIEEYRADIQLQTGEQDSIAFKVEEGSHFKGMSATVTEEEVYLDQAMS